MLRKEEARVRDGLSYSNFFNLVGESSGKVVKRDTSLDEVTPLPSKKGPALIKASKLGNRSKAYEDEAVYPHSSKSRTVNSGIRRLNTKTVNFNDEVKSKNDDHRNMPSTSKGPARSIRSKYDSKYDS